jgi:glutamine synthetase
MGTRIKLRNPDTAGNPYLQFALMLAAGLDGIEKKTMPPDHMEMDIFSLSPGEREKCGIKGLPGNLISAVREMERSELVKGTFGQQIMDHFKHVKEKEWGEYRSQVTQWEINNLLPVL